MSTVDQYSQNAPFVDPATGKLTIAGLKWVNSVYTRVGGTTAETNKAIAESASTAQSTAESAAATGGDAITQLNAIRALQFIVAAATGELSAEKLLSAGDGISITAGPGNVTVSVSANVSLKDSLGNTVVMVADDGSAASKLGLFGATPIARPTTSSSAATFVVNAGTAVNTGSTFGGYTLGQIAQALKDVGILT